MNKKNIYIETSVISFLTARQSRNVLTIAWQSITMEWWEKRKKAFNLYVSELVKEEASKGDVLAAKRRLKAINGLPFLSTTNSAIDLSKQIISHKSFPSKATDDALHISLASVHKMDYLLTWNCRHIDNAEIKPIIREIIIDAGYEYPEICTPQELMGDKANGE